MIRATAAILAAVTILAGTVAAAVSATPAPTLPACVEEDGSGPGQAFPCAWDAHRQGNGLGQSIVILSAP